MEMSSKLDKNSNLKKSSKRKRIYASRIEEVAAMRIKFPTKVPQNLDLNNINLQLSSLFKICNLCDHGNLSTKQHSQDVDQLAVNHSYVSRSLILYHLPYSNFNHAECTDHCMMLICDETIVKRFHKETSLPLLDKMKFLVPQETTMSQFVAIIRKRMNLRPNQAVYLLINNKSMLSLSMTMLEVYNEHKDEDGMLHVTYASQEVFGGGNIMEECGS